MPDRFFFSLRSVVVFEISLDKNQSKDNVYMKAIDEELRMI